ncbi:basic blue protein [Brachypodium distachyon]|uniref:Phytocyanin domain-containing protein n=1 Tax=Brachypodium distachyon TaxID=15368 RepID=I1HDZ8_BRADI|nr:basic blue protein [Brachypodium distachyon]KQK03636.1 hypothetical protein BRADI_2g09050v3 [Brachypodium distachyon]|eukprot:XP_003565597.1 basic blue protein [Brachypodium distachyon]
MARGSRSISEVGYGRLGVGLLLAIVLMLQVGSELAAAREWVVGDSSGWTFGVMTWPNKPDFKRFRVGDVLVFNYDPNLHNVIMVDSFGFGTCTRHPDNATVYSSGNDRITLGSSGVINFICGKGEHCYKQGMKMSLTVRQ